MIPSNPRIILGLAGLLLGISLVWAEAPKPQIVFEPEAKSELAPHGHGNIYAPSVLACDGIYRMWYGGQGRDGHDRIHLAESKNGETWQRRGVVLEDNSANHINDPCVLKVGPEYWMFYTHTPRDVVDRIALATSTDGQNWKPQGPVLLPGPQDSWDSLSVGRPTVILEDGLFRMWYDGRKDFPQGAPVTNVPKSADSRRYVGYATSRDGRTWVRHGPPVFGADAGAVDVKRIGDRLIMLFESTEGTRWASSQDGIGWTDRGLLLKKTGEALDAFGHVTPTVIEAHVPDRLWLFAGAATKASWDHNRIVRFSIARSDLTAKLDSK